MNKNVETKCGENPGKYGVPILVESARPAAPPAPGKAKASADGVKQLLDQ